MISENLDQAEFEKDQMEHMMQQLEAAKARVQRDLNDEESLTPEMIFPSLKESSSVPNDGEEEALSTRRRPQANRRLHHSNPELRLSPCSTLTPKSSIRDEIPTCRHRITTNGGKHEEFTRKLPGRNRSFYKVFPGGHNRLSKCKRDHSSDLIGSRRIHNYREEYAEFQRTLPGRRHSLDRLFPCDRCTQNHPSSARNMNIGDHKPKRDPTQHIRLLENDYGNGNINLKKKEPRLENPNID
jgi:hypothetical protein